MFGSLRELVEAILIALFVFVTLQICVQNFRVEGASMEPNILEGQYLLVNKIVYRSWNPAVFRRIPIISRSNENEMVHLFHPPHRGEVVVFHSPKDNSRDFVKRVIGIPGDKVEILDGTVYLNGQAINEPYVLDPGNSTMQLLTVPPLSFFVLGDNRERSNDSRDWGVVPRKDLVGKAWLTYWPSNMWGVIQGFSPEPRKQDAQ